MWALLLVAAAVGAIAAEVIDLGHTPRQLCAAAITTLLAVGLSARSGGRPALAGLLAVVLAGTAIGTGWDPLLAGLAVGTGVLAALLGVLATNPGPTYTRVIGEVLIAAAVGLVGAVGVRSYDIPVDVLRLGYVVLGVSLAACVALVYRLGAGLHGLGRRGYVVVGGAIALLALGLAYTEALRQWGSPAMIDLVDSVTSWTVTHLHAVPHPIEVLLGVPALAWGIFMRARRRQGWWVCAFGVAMTAPMTTRLVDTTVGREALVLSSVYSLALGLLLGYVVIRIEQAFTGSRGARARRSEEAAAHRPEPGRFRPLH